MDRFTILVAICLLIVLSFCKSENSSLVISVEQKNSEYVLPYPVRKTYECSQGWNGLHQGVFKYAVDFAMPIGTIITAARGGRVVYIREGFLDSDTEFGKENLVIVRHTDNTFGRYVHLTNNGALVNVDQIVNAGDTIALSGGSGQNFAPHLHFDVTKGCNYPDCQTIPIFFRNTSPHPSGLIIGKKYTAEPH